MKTNRKAKICDGILDKFRGNKSFDWDAIHDESFYKSIDPDYFEVENILNFLLGQGVNELEEYEYNGKKYLRLSRKGIFTISDLRQEGYVAKWREKKREKTWKYVVASITVATFALVGCRFYKDFIAIKPQSAISAPAMKVNINLPKVPDTLSGIHPKTNKNAP